jgi:hypothetical protein
MHDVDRCLGQALGAGGSRASRLPGRSLQVGTVCWLLAGWSRSAKIEPALENWSEFGLSRFSTSRGLATLEGAGLVSVSRRPGQSPIVTIVGTNVAVGTCRWEGELMPPIRLRIRTMIIAVAALAVLMGVVRTLLVLPAFSVWAEIQESDLVIVISVPSKVEEINGDAHYVNFDYFTRVPLMNVVVFVAMPTALLAVAVHHQCRRKRRASAFDRANRPFRDPAPDQCAEAENA